jgi:hypothetical protein
LEDQLEVVQTKLANTEAQLDVARWQSQSQAHQAISMESDLEESNRKYRRLQEQLRATTQCLTEMTEEFSEYRNQQLREQEERDRMYEEYEGEYQDDRNEEESGEIEEDIEINFKRQEQAWDVKEKGKKEENDIRVVNKPVITNVTKTEGSTSHLSPSVNQQHHTPPVNHHQTEKFIKHKIEEITHHKVEDVDDDEFDMVAEAYSLKNPKKEYETKVKADTEHFQRPEQNPSAGTVRTTNAAVPLEEVQVQAQQVKENNDRRTALREAWMNLASS